LYLPHERIQARKIDKDKKINSRRSIKWKSGKELYVKENIGK
jgi:hypothetical protein